MRRVQKPVKIVNSNKPAFDIHESSQATRGVKSKSISEGKKAENACEPYTVFRGKLVQKLEREYRISAQTKTAVTDPTTLYGIVFVIIHACSVTKKCRRKDSLKAHVYSRRYVKKKRIE